MSAGAGQRRRQITQVAMGLFARQGFDGTTTRRIAEPARVSEVIIFATFRVQKTYTRGLLKTKVSSDPSRTEGLEKRLETNRHDRQAQLFPPQALGKLAAKMVLEARECLVVTRAVEAGSLA